MAPTIVQTLGHLSPAEALELAEQAPNILQDNPKAISTSPLIALFSARETPELWTIYENLLISCLRIGNDEAARDCLDRLVSRFGAGNERIMALEGLVKEAGADTKAQLQAILEGYEGILNENAANIPIAKRRVALLRSTGNISDAITALAKLVDYNPTDAESWSELSDLYLQQGHYTQAIFSLEEVLVLVPNAWNIHAKLGELLLMAANSDKDTSGKYIAESLKRFCRSLELCDDYLRGYYGLKKVTDQILNEGGKSKKQDSDEPALPDQKKIEKLNQVATEKLAEIVRRYSAEEKLWQGYDADEVAAARELLSATLPQIVR